MSVPYIELANGSQLSQTIENSSIKNQDDCLAINKGSNIVFTGNTCSGGHGISIGSISSGVTVSGIVISNNNIVNRYIFHIAYPWDITFLMMAI